MKLFRSLTNWAAVVLTLLAGWGAPIVGAVSSFTATPAMAMTFCSVGVNYTQDCQTYPDPVSPGPNHPPPLFSGYKLYAAIAYSASKDRPVIVWQSESLSGAKSVALNRCANVTGAKDCKVVQTSNWCLSMAQSPGGWWGVGSGYVIESSRSQANSRCQSAGGKACRITIEHCAADS